MRLSADAIKDAIILDFLKIHSIILFNGIRCRSARKLGRVAYSIIFSDAIPKTDLGISIPSESRWKSADARTRRMNIKIFPTKNTKDTKLNPK